MASRTFVKENNVRYYVTNWGTSLTCHIPISRIAFVIRSHTSLGVIWNNANNIAVRSFNISAEAGSNVLTSENISATRDENDNTLVTITTTTNSTIEVFVPA